MSATRFKRQFRKNYNGYQGKQVDWGPGKTIPDQAIPIKVLLEKHSRGIPINVKHYPENYGYEQPVIEDLTDIEKMREELTIREQELKEQIDEIKRQKDEDDKVASSANEVQHPGQLPDTVLERTD